MPIVELTPDQRAVYHADVARTELVKSIPATSTALAYAALAVEARLEQIADMIATALDYARERE